MEFSEYKRMRDELKVSWQDLWRTLIDDEVRAEGIASEYFPELFTDRGDIIFATRDYKPLSFSEILERHLPQDVVDRINPSPDTGGIRKFISETFAKNQVERRRDPSIEDLSVKKQAQRKKGGRGWLHAGLGIKKAFSK